MSLALFQQWAADPNLAVLDTETTGLYGQVIELAIVDGHENVLLNERVKPTCAIEPGAFDVHGITDTDLAEQPLWPDVAPRFEAATTGKTVVVFNAEFDSAILFRTYHAYHLTPPLGAPWQCAMKAYARVHFSGRWQKLINACAQQHVQTDDLDQAHSALGDALRTLRLIQAVAARGEA